MNYSVRKTGRIDPAKAEEHIYGRKTHYRSPSAFIGGQFQLNKSAKTSRDTRVPLSSDQSPLNYSLEYRYENPDKPHQATGVGGIITPTMRTGISLRLSTLYRLSRSS